MSHQSARGPRTGRPTHAAVMRGIGWLQRQDAGQAQAFWQQELHDLNEPTRLALAIRQDKARLGTGYGEHQQRLSEQQTQALMQNPSIGVMAGVNYLSEQIEGSLVLSSGLPHGQP